eukprot:gene16121-21911_t
MAPKNARKASEIESKPKSSKKSKVKEVEEDDENVNESDNDDADSNGDEDEDEEKEPAPAGKWGDDDAANDEEDAPAYSDEKFQDETLSCKDCGSDFVFTAGEQEFYEQKGFDNKPVRCKSCKDAKKNSMGGGGRGNDRGFDRSRGGGRGGFNDRGGDRGGGGGGVCYSFQKGECTRGSSCRFSHEGGGGGGGYRDRGGDRGGGRDRGDSGGRGRGGGGGGACYAFQKGEFNSFEFPDSIPLYEARKDADGKAVTTGHLHKIRQFHHHMDKDNATTSDQPKLSYNEFKQALQCALSEPNLDGTRGTIGLMKMVPPSRHGIERLCAWSETKCQFAACDKEIERLFFLTDNELSDWQSGLNDGFS